MPEQPRQLKEVGGGHELQHVPSFDADGGEAAVVQIRHHQVEDVVADVVDLENGRGALAEPGFARVKVKHSDKQGN